MATMANKSTPSQESIKVQNGPVICDGVRPGIVLLERCVLKVAYLPPGQDSKDTSADVDYPAISSGKKCAWFATGVKELEDEGTAFFPCFSHGFDKELARVHKEQPNLSYAYTYEHNGAVDLWDMAGYESAGLWVDSGGHVCMPVWAQFTDGSEEMRLLYSSCKRSSAKQVTEEAQWICKAGKNKGLKKR